MAAPYPPRSTAAHRCNGTRLLHRPTTAHGGCRLRRAGCRAIAALVLGGWTVAIPTPTVAAPRPAPSKNSAAASTSERAAQPEPLAQDRPSAALVIDRVVARWISNATGGAEHPQFILARELAFEARVEALADGYVGSDGYADKHVRAAMQRHVTEAMLAALPVDPVPTPTEVAQYARAAQLMAEQRVGGALRLEAAARAEGLDGSEFDALWRRQARASAYLDRMVAPMLEPTDADIQQAYESRARDGDAQSVTEMLPALRRAVVAQRLAQALERYFRNARSRIVLQLIVADGDHDPPRPPAD